MKLLLKHGADTKSEGDKRTIKTPLHMAAQVDIPETVKVLVDAGANIDKKDYNGFTPLHLAAKKGFVNNVDILLAGTTQLFVDYTKLR